MRWATAISQAARIEDALDEALDTIASDLDDRQPTLIAAFASPDYLSHASRVVPHVAERHPDATLLGCSAAGIIGAGHEIEHERALSVTAAVLPDVTVEPFHLDDDPESWRQRIDMDPHQARAVVILPDPLTCPVEELIRWLDRAYPTSVKIGGLASGGMSPGAMALFAGRVTARRGAVGVVMGGEIAADTIVAQGCRPIGTPLFATRVEGNAILELDGQPALNVLETLHSQLSPGDQRLFRHSLFLGLVMNPDRQEYQQGDFLIRNILGVQSDLEALLVAAELTPNQVIQFHLRDAKTSAADLEHLLSQHEGRPRPSGALLFSCVGRGLGLYGHLGHDSGLFHRQFPNIALGGFFCNGEIGPVSGQTFLHGYTSSFALFRQPGQK